MLDSNCEEEAEGLHFHTGLDLTLAYIQKFRLLWAKESHVCKMLTYSGHLVLALPTSVKKFKIRPNLSQEGGVQSLNLANYLRVPQQVHMLGTVLCIENYRNFDLMSNSDLN